MAARRPSSIGGTNRQPSSSLQSFSTFAPARRLSKQTSTGVNRSDESQSECILLMQAGEPDRLLTKASERESTGCRQAREDRPAALSAWRQLIFRRGPLKEPPE